MAASSEIQKIHYERMHDAYAAHYYDTSSLNYRREFILRPLIDAAGVDLNDRRVADMASGSGYNSLLLKEWFPRVKCTGFDISPPACADYRRLTGEPAYEIDLTKPINAQAYGGPFDIVMVIGGLHHCVVDIKQTMANIAELVRPGGLFLMMEPNSRYVLEGVRRIWHRLDKSFDAATEAALDHGRLAEVGAPWFRVHHTRYLGGPAFFLIENSMITRVPLRAKPGLSKVLLPLERLYSAIPGTRLHAFFVAVWERLGQPTNEGQR